MRYINTAKVSPCHHCLGLHIVTQAGGVMFRKQSIAVELMSRKGSTGKIANHDRAAPGRAGSTKQKSLCCKIISNRILVHIDL